MARHVATEQKGLVFLEGGVGPLLRTQGLLFRGGPDSPLRIQAAKQDYRPASSLPSVSPVSTPAVPSFSGKEANTHCLSPGREKGR